MTSQGEKQRLLSGEDRGEVRPRSAAGQNNQSENNDVEARNEGIQESQEVRIRF